MIGFGRVDGNMGAFTDWDDDFSSRWLDLAVGRLASLPVVKRTIRALRISHKMARTRHDKGLIDIPLRPVSLHNRSGRRYPPLHQREEEQSDARPHHRTRARRYPSLEPQDISRCKMQVGQHVAGGEVHRVVHVHIHSVAGRLDRRREERAQADDIAEAGGEEGATTAHLAEREAVARTKRRSGAPSLSEGKDSVLRKRDKQTQAQLQIGASRPGRSRTKSYETETMPCPGSPLRTDVRTDTPARR